MWRRISIFVIAVGSTACASAGPSMRPVRSAGHDVITAAEIVASHVTDAYQAVLQLRPDFLRRRPLATATLNGPIPQVVVYLDDFAFGPAESMRHIPLDKVRQIRYLKPIEADLRFPGRHPAGVIHVITRPR